MDAYIVSIPNDFGRIIDDRLPANASWQERDKELCRFLRSLLRARWPNAPVRRLSDSEWLIELEEATSVISLRGIMVRYVSPAEIVERGL